MSQEGAPIQVGDRHQRLRGAGAMHLPVPSGRRRGCVCVPSRRHAGRGRTEGRHLQGDPRRPHQRRVQGLSPTCNNTHRQPHQAPPMRRRRRHVRGEGGPELAIFIHPEVIIIHCGPESETESVERATGIRTIAAMDLMTLDAGEELVIKDAEAHEPGWIQDSSPRVTGQNPVSLQNVVDPKWGTMCGPRRTNRR